MKRLAVCLFVSIAIGAWASAASAAGSAAGGDKGDKAKGDTTEPAATGDTGAEGAAGGDTSDALDLSDKGEKAPGSEEAAVKASTTLSWQDIVVVPRKSFLKGGRFEFAPFSGISVNDILIRHYVFGLDLNYFLTDVLSVGLQGNYYIKSLTERESLIGLQFNRIPTMNQYKYGGALNFGYVPIYGKFALFNKNILHWEIYASAGIGVTQTEVIPRNQAYAPFTNLAITPNVGIGGRFFLFDWLTVNYALRDYAILDKFEPADRGTLDPGGPRYAAAADAKAHADGQLVQNIMFYVGVGIYLPTRFQYKSPR